MGCNLRNDIENILDGSDKQVEPQKVDAVTKAIKEFKKQERAIDNERTLEQTATVMGSIAMDDMVQQKIDDGTYKKIEGMDGVKSLVDGQIKALMEHNLLQAMKRGFKASDEHYAYVNSFIDSVMSAMSSVGIQDISHKFEVYQTDNEFDSAYWKDGKGLDENTSISDGGKIVMLKGTNKDTMISNDAELLVHEFSHSVSEVALRSDGRLNRQVAKIQKEVMKQLTSEKLLAHIPNPTVSEKRRAAEIVRYMNSDPSEFLAYAVSNQNVWTAMQTMQIQIDTLKIDDSKSKNGFTKTVDMLKSIFNKVVSVISNGPTAASAFNSALGDIIAKNMQVKARMYTGQTFDDYASKVTGKKYEKVNEFMEKSNSVIADKLQKLKVMSPRTADRVADFAKMVGEIKGIQAIKETRIIQDIMHTVFRETTDTEFAASFQLIRKIKTENDKYQNSLKEINLNLVNSWFSDTTGEQREAVTDLLSADPSALGLNREQLANLLEDTALLNSKIEELKKSIGENEYIHQARDLGWYMMHGTAANPLLQTNAYRIYHRMYDGLKKVGLGERADADMIADIDKLASLYAMKYIDDASKHELVGLMRDESKVAKSNDITDPDSYHVVDLATKLYDSSLKEEQRDFGEAYSQLMDKGYMRKATKLPMKTKIVPEGLLPEMDKWGFKKFEFSQAATDMRNDGQKYYLVFASDWSVSRTQGAIHDIGYFDKVQQMSDIYDGHNIVYTENTKLVRSQLENNRLYRGFNTPMVEKSIEEMSKSDQHLMAVMKLDGKILDFSVPISRYNHENNMNGDRDIASTLAATVTHRSAKGKAIRGNMEVVRHLLATEAEHEDDDNYVVLRNSTDKEIRDGKPYKYDKEYSMIPDYTREYINKMRTKIGLKGDPNSIRIHKDMVNDFIGYKDASIVNFKLGKDGKYFDMYNHPAMALKAEQIQYWWKKMIARYKTVLVVLNPSVVYGNAISNFNIASVHGIDPITYSKRFAHYWKAIDSYSEIHNELLRTTSERSAGMKGLDNKIAGLEKQLAANPIHDLMNDGQFNMIIEDIDTYNNKEDHVEYQKRRILEKALGKEGTAKAKNLIANIGLTKDAPAFKSIEKLTVYNDIINRAIVKEKLEYDLEVAIAKGLINEDQRDSQNTAILNYIDQLFVNYSYLDNKYVKMANDVGLFLFTKYFFRGLKTLKQVYEKKPLSMTLFLGMEFGGLLPEVLDESPAKSYEHPIDAVFNRAGPITGNHLDEFASKILMPGSFSFF
jgi:hypothetical protein